MKLCNKCGKLMGYNSYFGGYYCTSCGKLEVETKKVRIFSINRDGMKKVATCRATAVAKHA